MTHLKSSVGNLADFSGVENFPRMKMESFVQSPSSLRGGHVHKPISHITFIAADWNREQTNYIHYHKNIWDL